MKNDLSCEVVKDLLPLYIDDLTSDVTNSAIEDHIHSCSQCSEVLIRMREPEIFPEDESADIDFLKKNRKINKRNILIGIIATFVIVLTAIVSKLYIIGEAVNDDSLIYSKINVEDKTLKISGNLEDSAKGVSDISFKTVGNTVYISFRETLKSDFNKNNFSKKYTATKNIEKIIIGNRTVWENGSVVSKTASKIFNTRHKYAGDLSKNIKTANALGISDNMGDFKNELKTKDKSIGWILTFALDHPSYIDDSLESNFEGYGSMLIALIDNLDYVTFKYKIDGEMKTCKITREMANNLYVKGTKGLLSNSDVKNVAKSPSGIDFLLSVFSPKKTVNLNSSLNTDTNSFDGLTHNNKTYKYKLILTGRSPNAACDSQYTVLSNDKNLTFETVNRSIYTSNSDQFLDPDVAVIIDMKTLDKGLK